MFQSDIRCIKKILVRAPNWIGDAVLCLPAIEVIKSAYPQAEITVLARPWVSPVFLNSSFVKGVADYDTSGRHAGIFGRLKLIKDIKKKNFDMAVLFQNAFEAAMIVFLAKIPIRIGYDRDFRGMLLTNPIKFSSDIKNAHQVFYYLNIVNRLNESYGLQPSALSYQPKICLTEGEKVWAKKFLQEKGINDEILIGMAPGASYGPAKRWMPERFNEVAARLVNDCRAKPVLFGGRDDREICGSVLGGLNGLNLSGEIDLRKSIALISMCGLFITNDSGPMHIAASLGIPTVAIFGSTSPELTGPVGDNVTVIKKDIECSPCFERKCRYGHYNCFKMIEEDEVYEASVKFLKESKNV